MPKVLVYHRAVCDTGCCGHAIIVDDEEKSFEYIHAHGEDPRVFAEKLITEELGPEHVKDLDWENSFVVDC